ncbi:MAG: nucleotidyltransferase family protein [Candidatus Thorarchaeota archaeon]
MSELRSRVNVEDTSTKVSLEEINQLKENTIVILPAGGKGTRIRSETHNEGINKVMISIDGKESMIQKVIREYSEFGIKQFVVLTGFLSEVVEKHLGDGSEWGVKIGYSCDPDGKKVGNAGAILHALNNGTIDDSLTSIIHNPDDVIVGFPGSYPQSFLEGHLKAIKNGCYAAFVVVPHTPYAYSGMIIQNGKVLDITKYPDIAIPTHTGITTFSPDIYPYFRRLVDLDRETSFESVVCPVLANEGRLFAFNISSNTWIPVNDQKGIEKAKSAML